MSEVGHSIQVIILPSLNFYPMRSVSILLALLSFFAFATSGLSQDWKLPDDIKLDKPEDYAKYKKDVLASIDFLEKTPANKKEEERKVAGGFLLLWLTGSPDVSVEVSEDVLTFMKNESSAPLLLIFMGGWTRYALNDPKGGKDNFQGNLAGLKSVIHHYRDIGGMAKDKEVDKLVDLEKQGKLEDWLRTQLAKQKK
jgi:hypothetical protein